MKNTMLLWLLCLSAFAQAQPDPFAERLPERSSVLTSDYTPDSIATKYPKFDAFLKQNLRFDVPITTVPAVQEELAKGEKILFLDARSQKSYEVSHIPGARRVGHDDFGVEKVWMIDRDAPIVVYCSIGGKSEEVSGYLQMMGFRNVRNLYGSIIEWVNYEQPLEDKAGQPTQQIFFEDERHLKAQFIKNRKIKVLK
jgi:rhodanese-related sulfurtransferase